MAAAGAVGGATLQPFQPNTFNGVSLDSIQNVFHFDTNNFLLPDTGESAVDYVELFSVLNDTAAQRSGGSSGGLGGLGHADSGGAAASPPAPQSYPFQRNSVGNVSASTRDVTQGKRLDATKGAKDVTSKRIRDAQSAKNKQQQVKELEALAALKSEHLERLTRENNELKFRKKLLEKVVRVRDHQLKVMRGTSDLFPPPMCEPVPGAPPTASSGSCSGSGGDGPVGLPGAGCSATVAIRNGSCGCLLSNPSVPLPPLDRERFRSMGKLQLMEGWKHFLSEVSVPLLAIEADPGDDEAAQSILRLAGQATFLFKHASLLAADTVMVASQTHLENETLSAPEPSHWLNVVQTLELTPEQLAELRAVFRLFQDIMRGVVAERKTINDHLATGVHGSYSDMVAALDKMTISPECEVMQALQRSMRREKAAHLLLRGFLFGNTLSVLQFTKAAVYAYPWMPDATALVATIAEVAEAAEAAGGGAASS